MSLNIRGVQIANGSKNPDDEQYKYGKGVPQDNIMAHMWYNIGAANGHELGGANRDKIAKTMTPAAIEKAKAMAGECLSSNYKKCAFAVDPADLQKLKDTNKCVECDLSGADLMEANLSGADLSGAKLMSTKLMIANLRGADLIDADLEGAKLMGAYLGDANLVLANLEGAGLKDAYLMGAKLMGAKLMHADLMGAYLIGANLEGASLMFANLDSADLKDAILCNTTMPDGSVIYSGC